MPHLFVRTFAQCCAKYVQIGMTQAVSVFEASAVSVASDRLQLEEVSADHIERKLDLPHHRAQEISHYLESEAGPSQC